MCLTIEVGFTNAFSEIVRNTIRSVPLMLRYCGIAKADGRIDNIAMKTKEIRVDCDKYDFTVIL